MKKQKTQFETFANLFCIGLLIGVVIYLVLNWNNIPEKIPAHYGFEGNVDRWGNKIELIFLPIVSWIIFIVLTVIAKFPKTWNTGVKITEENQERVYRVIRNMLETLKLLIVSVFTYITVDSSIGEGTKLKFIWVFMFLFFASIVFFIIKLVKAKL